MRKAFLILSLIITGFILLPFSNYAQEDVSGEEIKLYLGEVKVIPVNNPTRIVIGNPNVVDVGNATKATLTLNPKASGTTTLVYWDNFGEQSFKIKVFPEDMQEAKRRIDNLLSKLNLSKVTTQAEEEEGKILLLGSVKSPQERERIALVLGPLKDKTTDLLTIKEEETAIEIDVQVLELSKDATNALGFSWPGAINLIEKGSAGISDVGATSFSKIFKILDIQRGTSAGADPYTLKLDALVQEGKARILSRPRLACQSGKEAELLVGGEKPIFTTDVASAGGQGTSVEYKEYGIKLKIKPVVTDDNRIKTSLNVEISEVGTVETIGSSGGATTTVTAKAYPLSKRNVSTELYLNDGQTLSIGGLIKQKTTEDIRKTPWLGDIPVLGALFRKKTTTSGGGTGERGDTELFITLTPTIIQVKDAQQQKKESKPEVAVKTPIVNSSTESNMPEAIKNYVGIIQKRVLDNITYPTSAKEAGFQGTMVLNLHLSYLGELLETTIKTSSGYQVLDDNAISVARKLISFPPFPTLIEQKELWVDIPIVYQLN